jgi:hypothetical protein
VPGPPSENQRSGTTGISTRYVARKAVTVSRRVAVEVAAHGGAP